MDKSAPHPGARGLDKQIIHRIKRFLRGVAGVDEQQRIDVLRERIGELEKQTADLEEIRNNLAFLLSERAVDVVKNGPFLLFMYREDRGYHNLPEERKNKVSLLGRHEPTPLPHRDLEQFIRGWTTRNSAKERLVAHFLKHLPDFVAFDVGCQYATGAMMIARFIESFSSSNLVYAFDPGVAGRLAHFNIVNNGFDDRVRFYPYAVSDHDGYVLVFHHPGHSENFRIVNPGPARFATPVRTVSLDGFVDRQEISGRPVFLKIDTQGAEEEVFRGMEKIMAEGLVAGITEFTPSALCTRVAPRDFLVRLLKDHLVYETSTSRTIGSQISLAKVDEFVETVEQSPQRWTDLAFISRKLPAVHELVNAFGS